jgi:hypothetical protein
MTCKFGLLNRETIALMKGKNDLQKYVITIAGSSNKSRNLSNSSYIVNFQYLKIKNSNFFLFNS